MGWQCTDLRSQIGSKMFLRVTKIALFSAFFLENGSIEGLLVVKMTGLPQIKFRSMVTTTYLGMRMMMFRNLYIFTPAVLGGCTFPKKGTIFPKKFPSRAIWLHFLVLYYFQIFAFGDEYMPGVPAHFVVVKNKADSFNPDNISGKTIGGYL